MSNQSVVSNLQSAVIGKLQVIENLDGSKTEYQYMDPSAERMEKLFKDLYENHWKQLRFGPCVPGAVFELVLTEKPKVTMLDGYLTVDTGPWHFHLCLGEYKGTTAHMKTDPKTIAQQAQERRVSKAAFMKNLDSSCVPRSWGLRFWNGLNEQMITIFLPNPYLNDKLQRQKEPDWSRLELWEKLRKEYA